MNTARNISTMAAFFLLCCLCLPGRAQTYTFEFKEIETGSKVVYHLLGEKSISFSGLEYTADKKEVRTFFLSDGNLQTVYLKGSKDGTLQRIDGSELARLTNSNNGLRDIRLTDGRSFNYKRGNGGTWTYFEAGKKVLTGEFKKEKGKKLVVMTLEGLDPATADILIYMSGSYVASISRQKSAQPFIIISAILLAILALSQG